MQEGELFALLEGTADAAFTVDGQGPHPVLERIRRKAVRLHLRGSVEPVLPRAAGGPGGAGCKRRGAACASQGCQAPNFDLEVRVPAGRRIWVNISTLICHDEGGSGGLSCALRARRSARGKRTRSSGGRCLVSPGTSPGDAQGAPAGRRSEQERRILRGFAGGRNSAEIARDLGISLQTLPQSPAPDQPEARHAQPARSRDAGHPAGLI